MYKFLVESKRIIFNSYEKHINRNKINGQSIFISTNNDKNLFKLSRNRIT